MQNSIEEQLQSHFIKNKWTLSLAESCTGGAIASRLTKISGASNYFVGSLVTYSNELKTKLLGVPASTIDTYGAVSKEVVIAMVEGLIAVTNTDFGIAISGIAGPGGATPEKPVGTVWIAIGKKGQKPQAKLFQAHGDRAQIIESAVTEAISRLLGTEKAQSA